MTWNPDDPFYIPGIVSPEDWDWRIHAIMITKSKLRNSDNFPEVRIKTERYLGLLRELDRLDKLQHPPMEEEDEEM